MDVQFVHMAILFSTQIIMMGNTFGIPIGSFLSRFIRKEAFKPDSRSTLVYEIWVIFSLLGMVPVALIQAVFGILLRLHKARFIKLEKNEK